MKSKKNILVICFLIIVAIGMGVIIFLNTNKKENDEKTILENNIQSNDEKTISENNVKNNDEKSNNNSNVSAQKNIVGKYINKSVTDNYYYEAHLNIDNQTDSSIDFTIFATYGPNADHVNNGDLSGKATKIDIPEKYIIPESTQYAYQFVDTIDGKTNKIIFVYTAHKMFEYVTVIEEYASDYNPYAGDRVYFAGEYDKISELSTPKNIIGQYNNKPTNNYYYEARLNIDNQTDSSIDFTIFATYGPNADHVNNGDLSGKATKIDIPEKYIIPESTQYAYQFVDTIDGKTNKITFVYTAHKTFEYVTVIEEYASDYNPYAGDRVYFAGEYNKTM